MRTILVSIFLLAWVLTGAVISALVFLVAWPLEGSRQKADQHASTTFDFFVGKD
jgi:hypothetical protein